MVREYSGALDGREGGTEGGRGGWAVDADSKDICQAQSWFKCIRPEHPAHGGGMLRTVQFGIPKKPLGVHSKETIHYNTIVVVVVVNFRSTCVVRTKNLERILIHL